MWKCLCPSILAQRAVPVAQEQTPQTCPQLSVEHAHKPGQTEYPVALKMEDRRVADSGGGALPPSECWGWDRVFWTDTWPLGCLGSFLDPLLPLPRLPSGFMRRVTEQGTGQLALSVHQVCLGQGHRVLRPWPEEQEETNTGATTSHPRASTRQTFQGQSLSWEDHSQLDTMQKPCN